MRKAQAALEFLTTYGWAFIVILVMIGALAYFGVLNPSKVTPNRCIVEAGFDCNDYKITTTDAQIMLYNKKGDGMTISSLAVSSDANNPQVGPISCTLLNEAAIPPTQVAPPVVVSADRAINISCANGIDFSSSKGSKVKIDFTITYTMAKGTFSNSAGGSIYAVVQ
jgi:hypothetical protein